MITAPPDLPRRGMVQRLLVGLLTIIAFVFARGRRGLAAVASDPLPDTDDAAHRWGMAIDLDRCTGCGACVVACQSENNVPQTGPAASLRGTGITWMDLLPSERPESAELPPTMLPIPCMQCENAPCVKVCPVGATYQGSDGIVAQIYDRCIGCRFCQVACPYGRRYFNWTDPSFPETHVQYLNPDVSLRTRGVVEKCNFCQHRVRDAHESAQVTGEPLTDDVLRRLPACAQSCPATAITFGDLNDSDSEVSKASRSPRASRLLEHLGTKPRVWYLARDRS